MSSLEPVPEYTMAMANEKFSIGFPALIGFEFLEWRDGHVMLGLQVQDRHLNLHGAIHGGVLATLLDIAGACPGTFCPYPGRIRKALTLSMTTTFTGQARGGYIRAIGTRRAGGSRIYNTSVDIVDETDRLLAFGEGTFRLRSGCDDPRGIPATHL
ncbi:phenylacetic acid degradation-related protein [Alcanivorax sp. N3-2A]|nr:phenylacetic acid degradation-related protein [Alcanivorax sp. N3-2A]|tara:strand:+ start:26680 stop:27147 length:468 start_codon:yes stop_codon:yes gene_type:complete